MKKIKEYISKISIFLLLFVMSGLVICCETVDAEEVGTENTSQETMEEQTPEAYNPLAFESLVDGMKIIGPDYVFAYKETASFTLWKDGYEGGPRGSIGNDEEAYQKLHYKWSSNNPDVANFYTTEYTAIEGCIGYIHAVLYRPNIFNIKPGTATIFCEISDDEGHHTVLSKELTVIENTPMKKMQLGTHQIQNLNSSSATIYTNDKEKELKLQVTLEQGWEVVSQEKLRFKCNCKDYILEILMKNKENEREFTFSIRVTRYIEHKISLKKLKEGNLIYLFQRNPRPLPDCWTTLTYKKNNTADEYTFHNGKQLVEKIKYWTEHNDETISFKNGILTYKETLDLHPIIFCESEAELNCYKKYGTLTRATKKSPIKSLQIGKTKFEKQKIKKKSSVVRFKTAKKKVKLNIKMNKRWKAQKITYREKKKDSKTKDITKNKTLKLSKGKTYMVEMELKNINKKIAQSYIYRCRLKVQK